MVRTSLAAQRANASWASAYNEDPSGYSWDYLRLLLTSAKAVSQPREHEDRCPGKPHS